MTNTNKTVFEVYGVTKSGSHEFQDAVRTRESAERIGRVIADGYSRVVIRETAAL